MPGLSGKTRHDVALWSVGIVLAAAATLIGSLAGARLGAALTGGLIIVVATVLTGLARDTRDS